MDITGQYKNVVIQIASPYCTGTGFYLKEAGLIITHEQLATGNREVAIQGLLFPKQLAKVVFLDSKYGFAFLEAPLPADLPIVRLAQNDFPKEGDNVIAFGHPFGLNFSAAQGKISNFSQGKN